MSGYVGADPESLLWRPQRTRVLTESVQNPWSRTGSQARDHRAFYASVDAHRMEEDEDYEVLAPPRPTIRWVQGTESWTEGWFVQALYDELLADDLREFGAGYEHQSTERIGAQARTRPDLVRLQPAEYDVTLEDNLERLGVLDERINRAGPHGHWIAPSTVLYLLCSDGTHRSITAVRATWVLEYGQIHTRDRLARRCGWKAGDRYQLPSGWWAGGVCVAPDHHKKITKRGPRDHTT